MSKDEYIRRSLSKTRHKTWEHYAVTRIFHRLNDPEVEFVCQQCIRRADGKFYLADLFFPQFGIYLEIDEGYHEGDAQRVADAIRSFDIADSAGLTEHRIAAVGVSIEQFDRNIDHFIDVIRDAKRNSVAFRPWSFEGRYTAAPHLEKGYLEIGRDAAFRTHRDALQCFGYKRGDFQRGVWAVPPETVERIGLKGKCVVWFPTLREHKNWDNSLSEDGLTIVEKNRDIKHEYKDDLGVRITMARSRDMLNSNLYRFVGAFEVDEDFRIGNEHRFHRIASKLNLNVTEEI